MHPNTKLQIHCKTKQMELVIDSRETKILQIIETNPQLLSSYKYKKEYLDLADFILSDASGHSLFFERKTWADLAGSLTDGRFREQRSRLLQQRESSAAEKIKVCYIIEGLYREDYKREKHAVTRLQFVYSIPVFYSQSLMNTIEILREFLEKEEKWVNLHKLKGPQYKKCALAFSFQYF